MSPDPILRALADCNPNEALKPTDPRFVDLDDIRGQALRKYLLKSLEAADLVERYEKVAVAGNRGSGKSTELNRAETVLQENGYETLWAAVNENLDPKEISFSDIVRLIVQLIDLRFGQETAHFPQVKEAFDSVYLWFQEVTKTFTEQINSAKELGLGAGIGGAASVEFGGEAGANVGAVATSGGCWRDLLRLLQESLLRAEKQVGPVEVKAAVQQVAQTYQRLLRSSDDLQILAHAHLKHTVLSDEKTQYLLHHLCLLSYNGEGWYDFHPLLENYMPVKEAVEAARRVNAS